MTPFEEQLKSAMARREPPGDFTARVLAKAGRPVAEPGKWGPRWMERIRLWRLIPVLAMFLLMTGGAVYQQRQRAARGEAAKEKLLVAMQIAGSKLHDAQQHVIDVEGPEVNR